MTVSSPEAVLIMAWYAERLGPLGVEVPLNEGSTLPIDRINQCFCIVFTVAFGRSRAIFFLLEERIKGNAKEFNSQ
jgi:hypothetical protein